MIIALELFDILDDIWDLRGASVKNNFKYLFCKI